MADSAVTPFVFLDTEVFRAHQLDFQAPNILRLVKLAVEGAVRLLLTTVTYGEVVDDLKVEAQKALKELKVVRRDARVMRKIIPGEAMDAIEAVKREGVKVVLCKEFDDFIAGTGATVLDVDKVSPEGVFKKYFAGTAPFGGEGSTKKVEFPDAFACGALEVWSTANNNAKIYVVSNDGDWKKICEGSPVLILVARLDELLQHFTDTEIGLAIKRGLEAQREELRELLRAEAEGLDYYVGADLLINGEVESFEIIDVDIEDYHVVEIKDGEASVSVLCGVTVSAELVADDPDSGIKDPETKSVYYMFRMAVTVDQVADLTADVAVTYQKDDPEQVAIKSVEFEENSIELFVDEQELERVDDNDYVDDNKAEYQQHLHDLDMEYQQDLMENMEPPDNEEP